VHSAHIGVCKITPCMLMHRLMSSKSCWYSFSLSEIKSSAFGLTVGDPSVMDKQMLRSSHTACIRLVSAHFNLADNTHQTTRGMPDVHALVPTSCLHVQYNLEGKTGVTADRDKIEFRLFNNSSIFNIILREELFS